ncbi:MAG: hypothetical protein D4S01_07555, partial [Dehalococcoidia bacterium]
GGGGGSGGYIVLHYLDNIDPALSADITGGAGSSGGNPGSSGTTQQAQIPNVPTSLAQYQFDGNIPIDISDTAIKSEVVFKMLMSKASAANLRPQVEIKPVGQAFDGQGLVTGNAVSYSGTPVLGQVAYPDLTFHATEPVEYHWRARVLDGDNNPSLWVSFGNNTETQADLKGPTGEIVDSDIVAVPLSLTSPAGAEVWIAGTTHAITWTSQEASAPTSVRLKYSIDQGQTYRLIAIRNNTAGANSYTWTIPSDMGENTRVKTEDITNPQVYSELSQDFTISYPVITITSPVGGEQWQAGSTQEIAWTSNSPAITHVRLEYSTDDGASWNLIEKAAPNTGTYQWDMYNVVVNSQTRIKATGLSLQELVLSNIAAQKVSAYAWLENNYKAIALDVLDDFIAGDVLTISGLEFTNFSGAGSGYLGLDIYNNNADVLDDKKIHIAGSVYTGGSGDGWAYTESN